jgi:hypothetical protein
MGLSHSPSFVMDGLLIAFDAANQRSYPRTGTTISNLTGSISGSMINGVGFSSANSGFFSFDGTNDAVGFSNNPTLTNQITISVWIKPSNNGTNNWILGREASYRMFYTSSIFVWDCATTNNGWYTTGTNIVSNSLSVFDNWWNVVGTYNGSNLRLYINGSLQSTGANISGNIQTTGYTLNLMQADNIQSVVYGKGNVSQFLLYGRALSTQEVLQNYNATKKRYGL